MMTLQQAFHLAVQHHQAGRLTQAEQLYRQILARQPNHADALHCLGLIAHQAGRPDLAVTLIMQSLARSPNQAAAFNNLGNAHAAQGEFDNAIVAYRQAILLMPGFAEAFNNLGNALNGQKRMAEAADAFRQAVAFRPDYAEAWTNLGDALKSVGELDEAVVACRRAIALKPALDAAYNNLGNALAKKGQLDDAIAAFRKAISLRPAYTEACCNLGVALTSLAVVLIEAGEFDAAIAACCQATDIRPDNSEACNNLGSALKGKGKLNEAIEAYGQAIVLKPHFPEALTNLAIVLTAMGRLDEAIDACRKAIEQAPEFAGAYIGLGDARREKGQLDEAVAAYRRAIALNPNSASAWSNLGNALKDTGQVADAIMAYRQAIAHKPGLAAAHSNLVYTIHFHSGSDNRTVAEELRCWNRNHAEPLATCIHTYANIADRDRRLRIGYVSPDFRDHPVGRFILPLLENHDRSGFEVFAYAQVPSPDRITDRLRSHTDAWRNTVGFSDAQVTELIRQDRIDILVDLAMHTAQNRLLVFARKPAPVQVSYLAYCSSTGLKTIDYRLSDPYLDPPAAVGESFYSEKTILLAQTYWCYDPAMVTPEVGPIPALANGYITFGCLNNFCKVSESALSVWSRILQRLPRSRLLIHAREGSHRDRLLRGMELTGIEPDRISFVGMMPAAEYFEAYGQIDIALDPFPFAGGTTTCDSLWMGVPVVTFAGKSGVGRGGLSILFNIGLPELVAHSEDEYIQIATELACDLPRLNNLRSALRQQMKQSPLMDAPRFASHVESAYQQMWLRWCETAARADRLSTGRYPASHA